MRRALLTTVAIATAIASGALFLSRPQPLTLADLPQHEPNAVAGERIFWAGGCASCHASLVDGDRASGEEKLLLGGGLELESPYGVFRAPNISMHTDDGIGGWTMLEFVNAMQRGVSPAGKHYYPAFPYASYAKMPISEVMDLKVFMDGLPIVAQRTSTHDLAFPWNLRRGIGFWKRRYLDADPIVLLDAPNAAFERGRQLVEGAGHCGECHTPRDALGGMQSTQWLAGAPNAEGTGRVPNITPSGKSVSAWSMDDLAYYFESGLTPDYDTVGGSMVAVQENLAELSNEDRDAIAVYLKAIPAAQ